jgi:3-oxoacyl-[acyl-carrier-protein] synthase II
MSKRRVVITGMGAVTPLGNDLETTWAKLIAGVSGIDTIKSWDVSAYPSRMAGEVKDFNPENYVEKKEIKRYDKFILFAIAASKEAFKDAGLELDCAASGYNPDNCGCIFGVGIGGLPVLEENLEDLLASGPRKLSPFLIPAMITNLAPGNLAITHNLRGVNYTVTSACTSGTHAIGEAFRMIADGIQDMMVTGGSESAITKLGLGGFGRMRALSTRNDEPKRASRPFDRDRDGFVIGEGAGVLILEEYEAAKRRGAKIYAEVAGYGFSCDAYHITGQPEDARGAVSAMRMALKWAGMAPEQIGYINAHGTSTPVNDPSESRAIKTVFGAHAHKGLLVSSTKSMTGHLLGAAGGMEGVFLAKAIETGVVPPTINLDNPDEGCDLDYVPHKSREVKLEAALSNSFGFGGTNGSILFKRV